GLARWSDASHRGAAALGIAFLAAVGQIAHADARRLVGVGTDEQHVGDVDGHFLGQTTALLITAAGLHVLVDAVDFFYEALTGARENGQHAAALAPVVAGNHFHRIVFLDVHGSASLSTSTRQKGS